MDYEKEYKEMVKRVKEFHEAGNFVTRQQMEIICPELAESEDERIRKKLCEFIHDTLGDELDGYDITKQDALAWLEKQKEQKPVEWSEEDEAMMNNILRVLSCFIGSVECESNTALSTSYPLYRREIDWLKSLRGRIKEDGKPSES